MLIAILAILVPLWILLRKDFVKGLAFAIYFWVSMTTLLRIQLPGAFPALTIHRLMLITVVVAWLIHKPRPVSRSMPLRGFFVFWFLASVVSLVSTQIDFTTSLKTFLDFVLEIFIFYMVVSTSLNTGEDALRILHAAWLGLLTVAFLAAVERYTGFNPVFHFIPDARAMYGGKNLVIATYPHRILLGAAMAMGVPLSFMLRETYRAMGKKLRFFWIGLGLLIAASYFALSRGPWLGLLLACGIMVAMGSRPLRKTVVLLGLFGVLMLLTRPGIVGTLSHFVEDTTDTNSFKGNTAAYRLELWRVAFHEISKSPWEFLFGYGPSAGSEIQIDWVSSYSGKREVIDSWDNNFAYMLFQYGFVGLIAALLLYFKGLAMFYSAWRRSWPPWRDILACLLATAAVLVWMMTNVLIFAKQLHYLFWTLIAAGFVILRPQDVFVEPEDGDERSEVLNEPLSESAFAADPSFNLH